MEKQKILGMPTKCAIGIILTCLIGIIIGSFYDFSISVALANKTDVGKLFANYGGIISYFLYPTAGICLFKGIKCKEKRWNKLAWGLLFLAYFMGVYYCNFYFGGFDCIFRLICANNHVRFVLKCKKDKMDK